MGQVDWSVRRCAQSGSVGGDAAFKPPREDGAFTGPVLFLAASIPPSLLAAGLTLSRSTMRWLRGTQHRFARGSVFF